MQIFRKIHIAAVTLMAVLGVFLFYVTLNRTPDISLIKGDSGLTRDILAEEQLKLELRRVLSKYFLRQIEDLIRNQTGAFFPVEGIHSLELGQRLGRRKELQLMNITVVDSLQNRKFSLDLAFKFLQNADAAVEEGNGAVWLGEILKTNYKVHTSQLLYFSHSNSLLIYEGLKGTQEFFESPLDEPQKLFLAGLALPYIHGIFRQKVQVDRYLHLITNVLNGIPFNPDETSAGRGRK